MRGPFSDTRTTTGYRGFQLVERDDERIAAAEDAIAAFVALLPSPTRPS